MLTLCARLYKVKVLLLLVCVACDLAYGALDLSKIFGNNVNNAEAWSQLMNLKNCPKPQPLSSTIIMINESVAAGAKFIAHPNVTSRYECEFECCYKIKDGCNIAVYASEQKHCYLFNCGQPSKCRFEQRSGYTVSLISDVIDDKEEVTVAATKPATTPASTTASPSKKLHLLDGCRPDVDSCVTPNTHCSNKGFCMCKDGFHPKNGVCRKDCLESLEFECTNGDAKYGQPDCIAVYDVCDGIPQCSDGSDEKNCEKKDAIDWTHVGSPSELKAKIKEYMKSHPDVKEEVLASQTSTSKSPSYFDIKALLGQSNSDAGTDLEQLAKVSTAEKSAPTPADVKAVSRHGNPSDSQSKDSSATSAAVEKVVIKGRKRDEHSTRSAVIALSLSLTLTVVLIAYLGCRYKSVSSRVGRGKARPYRGAAEIDYLIDGMYL